MKTSQLRQLIREEIIRELNQDALIYDKIWIFIIVKADTEEILTKSGIFKQKPYPTEMEIFDDLIDVSSKIRELEKKGEKNLSTYELNNSWDLK